MAASSPRCIQQLAASPKPILTKSISPPPRLTIPSTFTSHSSQSPIALYNSSEQPSPISTTPDLSTNSPSLHSPVPSVHTPPPQFSEPNSWVATLLKTKFYGPCPIHAGLRKNDQNLFCIDHAEKICQYCYQADHPQNNSDSPCSILHVSRYMYHDVLLAKEAASLLDIAEVQSYLNNGNRVVYIDRRAQPKSKLAPHAKSCVMCSRTLQDPYRFCSLFCRLRYANDPAATETIPLPDASPLLHPAIKKVKHPGDSNSMRASATRKQEREWRRSESVTPSPPRTPLMSHSKRIVKTKDMPSPLRLTSIKKRRRKPIPNRSPLPSATLLMLAEVAATVFMCD